MQLRFKPYLHIDNQDIDAKKVSLLLEAIKEHGSLSKASKSSNLSYKGAWDLLNKINKDDILVVSQTGGKQGGGSKLTSSGEKLVKHIQDLEKLNQILSQIVPLYEAMDKLDQVVLAIRNSLYKNRIAVVIEDIKQKADWQLIFATVDGEKVRAKTKTQNRFYIGQKVWFVFDTDSTNTKGDNLFKGFYAGKEEDWTKVIVENQLVYIDGKYQLKNGLVHFNVKPKNIEVVPCSID